MSDVTDQLAGYFDATVERITAEDVLERATGLDHHPVRRPRRRPHPVVVFSLAALTVIVLIGGAGWLIGREMVQQPAQPVAALGPPLILQPSEGNAVDFGSISISIKDWSGAEGYQVLAGVFTEDYDLVGGALWVKVDQDPFSASDVVHPPMSPYENTRDLEPSDWGLEDYDWDEPARLEPGVYRITLWANPQELHPYGSHLPASSNERACHMVVEVSAGEVTSVVVTDIPKGSETCLGELDQWKEFG